MAWDIFHLKHLHFQSSYKADESDLLIPLFCSYDNNLIKEIFSYFSLDAIAICYRTHEIFPYYHKHSMRDSIQEKYCDLNSVRTREERRQNIQLTALIKNTKQQFCHCKTRTLVLSKLSHMIGFTTRAIVHML